jgi:hypothetical protein
VTFLMLSTSFVYVVVNSIKTRRVSFNWNDVRRS